MFASSLAYPLIAMALLVFIAWFSMFFKRMSEINKHNLRFQDLNVFNKNLTKKFLTSGDNYRNLFEMPVMYYVAILLVIILKIDNPFYLYTAWGYVLIRYLHTFIHITYNKVFHRFLMYAFSCFILLIIWIKIFFDLTNF